MSASVIAGAFGLRAKRPRGKAMGNRRPLLVARPERNWCAYCAMPSETWDHVEPWSQCRDNSVDNLVPCCNQCNNDKGDLSLIVFLALTVPECAE